MISTAVEQSIQKKYRALTRELDERSRRLWAAAEADSLGHGGVAAVSRATGLAESTIRIGCRELRQSRRKKGTPPEADRIRREGAGRRSVTEIDPGLRKALKWLVESTTRGDPMSPLLWTCKSTRNLAEELTQQGHPVGHSTVAEILKEMGYSLQGTRKSLEGKDHPDRNEQFEYINEQIKDFQGAGQPVISVDCKKKENIGEFEQRGREYRRKGRARRVRTHDFPDEELGKAIPYGVYDIANDMGWVNVGIDKETSVFAVESIRRWWQGMGRRCYKDASQLLIVADAGGSNGYRRKLWKVELQQFADRSNLEVHVCHFPPGTSKWNKIEHRMFCHITKNWRGEPLTSLEVAVNLIANTRTRKGLRIKAGIDPYEYPSGIEVTKQELEQLNLTPDGFHGEWNYMLAPRN
jgi:hypothetical protein